jgi:hypothetical protein
MPSTTAMRKCPELVFVPPRFEVYKAVSRQIHAVFADYTPLIEPLSLDEAYLDVTANLRGLPSASATAEEIRARILAETGLTASAGVSYNKFLAKLASDQRKPNGQFVVAPGRGEAFVESLPVGRFHGVGPVTEAKMKRLGIHTGADLRARTLQELQQHFRVSGVLKPRWPPRLQARQRTLRTSGVGGKPARGEVLQARVAPSTARRLPGDRLPWQGGSSSHGERASHAAPLATRSRRSLC